MKATIVLIADNEAENFGRKLMLEAHKHGKNVFPSNVLNGLPSGCMSLRVKETPQLTDAQKKLNEGLYAKFGPCSAEHDDDYIFHMTFAIGGAGLEAYERAYAELIKLDYKKSFRFNELGLLYYDDDNIKPGTYFCYKVCEL